jgi:hypothetical protein
LELEKKEENLLLAYELSMGEMEEERAPEDISSRKGFRKGMQAVKIERFSWIVVKR